MDTNGSIKGDASGRPPAPPPGAGQLGWCDGLTRARTPGPTLPGDHADETWHDATRCVHAGSVDDPASGAVGTPIVQSTTFLLGADQYRSIEQGYARDRFVYSRYGNPSQWAVQTKLAALDRADSALVFSSGMAAIASTICAMVDRGGHVVTSCDLYGGTYNLFHQDLPTWSMTASFVDPRDLAAIESAITPNTQLLYFEALTNPLLKLADIPAIVDLARKHKLRVVIDATFVTPLGCRPLDLGVDVVVHSASKYLNGHSDLIAGVAAGSRKLVDRIWGRLLTLGGSMDPHACFLLERGLKTLALRMRAIQDNATAIARFLESHPKITRVFYPRLDSHPDHALAEQLLTNAGGIVSFVIAGGDAAALRLMQETRLPREATSLGGVESLISTPFNTSHATLTAAQRHAMGIAPGTVRLAVGIEDARDLIADLEGAIARATADQPATTNPTPGVHA